MLYYETMYIVHPALESGRLKDLILLIEKSMIQLGGKTHMIDVWGKKKLAYSINKEKYGMYILFQFSHDGTLNKEFNLILEHNSNILAYLTTKIGEEELLDQKADLDNQLGLLTNDSSNASTSEEPDSSQNNSKSTEDSNISKEESPPEASNDNEVEPETQENAEDDSSTSKNSDSIDSDTTEDNKEEE